MLVTSRPTFAPLPIWQPFSSLSVPRVRTLCLVAAASAPPAAAIADHDVAVASTVRLTPHSPPPHLFSPIQVLKPQALGRRLFCWTSSNGPCPPAVQPSSCQLQALSSAHTATRTGTTARSCTRLPPTTSAWRQTCSAASSTCTRFGSS